MEISSSIREILVLFLIAFFIGSIFYSVVIADKDTTVKKHS